MKTYHRAKRRTDNLNLSWCKQGTFSHTLSLVTWIKRPIPPLLQTPLRLLLQSDELFSIFLHWECPESIIMVVKCVYTFTSGDFPYFNQTIGTCTNNILILGQKVNPLDSICRTFKTSHAWSIFQVPNSRSLITRCSDDESIITAERDIVNRSLVTTQNMVCLTSLYVPNLSGLIVTCSCK